LKWEIFKNKLSYNISIDEKLRNLFDDYLANRFRKLLSQSKNYILPNKIVMKDNKLILEFPDNIDDYKTTFDFTKINFNHWKNQILNPLLEKFIDAQTYDIFGFSQFKIIDGKFFPTISYFIGSNGLTREFIEKQKKLDQQTLSDWINKTSNLLFEFNEIENKRFIESTIKGIRKGSLDDLNLFKKFSIESSFLDILTEAEFFQKIKEVYRYKIVPRNQAINYGKFDKDELLLQIDSIFKDSIFGKINRPTIQEIWDHLMEDRRISRQLVISNEKYFPNPLIGVNRKATRIEWIRTHEDQPLIFIKKFKERIPKQGYLYVLDYGEIDQIRKKRKFIDLAKNHINLLKYLKKNQKIIQKDENHWSRDELVKTIVKKNGLYAVQGPPGTGKTYLATEVITRFLKINPYAKILICSKEHLSLNHILLRTTSMLEENDVNFNAYRSISTHRFRRSDFDKNISPYINTNVIKEIGKKDWNKKMDIWRKIQDNLPKEFDLRNRSLAEISANLFFCTTMDSAMNNLIRNRSFDLVIIEEAGKCYPSEILHSLCLGNTVIMIGDQNQLPPYQIRETTEALRIWEKTIVKAKQDKRLEEILERRFGNNYKKIKQYFNLNGPVSEKMIQWLKPFEYLFNILPKDRVHVLNEQYRMEKPLSDLIANVFYNREFIHKKESYHPLKGILPTEFKQNLLWIDTPHTTNKPEAGEDPEKTGERINTFELEILIKYLQSLKKNKDIDLVILTPYNDQKDLFLDSEKLQHEISNITSKKHTEVIKTADEYQGHEADLTIISLVRNNTLGAKSSWGFIVESERLNVMFSRSKSHQVVIGCSEHILRNEQESDLLYLSNLFKLYKQNGKIISAKEIFEYES